MRLSLKTQKEQQIWKRRVKRQKMKMMITWRTKIHQFLLHLGKGQLLRSQECHPGKGALASSSCENPSLPHLDGWLSRQKFC